MPLYAAAFMVFTLANTGLPGTSGFVGEFLALIGTFPVNRLAATLATLGVILSAGYALWLYRKMIFGQLRPTLAGIKDLDAREILVLAPLVALTIFFGIYPKPVLDMSAASVAALLENYEKAIGAAKSASLQPFPIELHRICPAGRSEMAVDSCLAHVLIGEPVSTSPEHARVVP
jgi:NADH-quinone oxidoreductase subunit M